MRPAYLCAFVSFGSLVHSQVPAHLSRDKPRGRAIPPPLRANVNQRPIMDQDLGNLEKLEKLLPALPGGSAGGTPFGGGNGGGGGGQGSVMLSDVMGRDRSINIFAGFTRDVDSIAQRLDDKSKNSTVLAPLNSQIEKLPRKPWEDAQDYDTLGTDAYEGDDGMDRAKKNTRRFVEAHIVPENPWDAGVKTKTLGGETEVWWEEKDGKKVIQPGDIEVVSVASSVANGQVWIIRGVLSRDSKQ